MARQNRQTYFMAIAMAVRLRANCKGNRVGAIIVQDHRIVSTGYNGTPANMVNCLDDGCYRCANRDKAYQSGEAYDLCICVHAEQNAIIQAALHGVSIEDATVYCTHQPCILCTKMIINGRIKRVVFQNSYPDTMSIEFLKHACVEIVCMPPPEPETGEEAPKERPMSV